MAAKQRGRPELPEQDKRSEWIMVRLRASEYQQLINAAHEREKKPATLARDLLLRALDELDTGGAAPEEDSPR